MQKRCNPIANALELRLFCISHRYVTINDNNIKYHTCIVSSISFFCSSFSRLCASGRMSSSHSNSWRVNTQSRSLRTKHMANTCVGKKKICLTSALLNLYLGNIQIYLHFQSILETDMVQVRGIILLSKTSNRLSNVVSMLWLLMPGDRWSQAISSHNIDLICPEYCSLSTRISWGPFY